MTDHSKNLQRCEKCNEIKNPVEIQLRNDSDNETTETFHVCPNIDCDEHERDIREKERWKLKTDPDSEYSEKVLDEIAEEILEMDRMTERVKTELAESDDSTPDANTMESTTEESIDSAQSAREPTSNDPSSDDE